MNKKNRNFKVRLDEILKEEIIDAKKGKYEPSQKLLRLLK